jgi:hypothetical protein
VVSAVASAVVADAEVGALSVVDPALDSVVDVGAGVGEDDVGDAELLGSADGVRSPP